MRQPPNTRLKLAARVNQAAAGSQPDLTCSSLTKEETG